jgi:hypothetical protein
MAPPTTSVSTAKRGRTSRVTGVGAVSNVADALRDVTAQFNADSSATSGSANCTPQCRTAAIRAAATDQRLKILHLFCDNIAAADSYLAIDDAELRTDFILGAL